MKKSRFSEHQIITILKSGEAGRTAKDVCREHDQQCHVLRLEEQVRRHGSFGHQAYTLP